jgi:hypothetical protein
MRVGKGSEYVDMAENANQDSGVGCWSEGRNLAGAWGISGH